MTGIPKLDDANDAGGRNSQLCTLILTEGDSAKTLAVSGLSVVGRDHYGVFPLRCGRERRQASQFLKFSEQCSLQGLGCVPPKYQTSCNVW